ncbi:hypothetical protein [Chlorogloea sp. CCALA 695]|uniref:hypothetical protein n=1 Tax=Chlorogloea sp. CCALA 695 TaxID=2107693 RepID=UPI000D0527E8|nr:hypothetical protein [Chlorogloea sp. CCALA 695]PSB26097.1 hypothetical protein C7B70_24280 [Chlorogloea sp. CCALA 695]
MNLHLAFQTFLSYLDSERDNAAALRLKQIAKSENLDNFLGIEDLSLGGIYYFTTHGFRTLNCDRPDRNQFVVAKKGNGFSIAKNLPYIYLPISKCEPPQLIVESPSESASAAGYAQAVKLPYTIAGKEDDYPEGTLVVCVTLDNERAAINYANASPLPYDRKSVYIEDLRMLDTEYAAMLEDVPRF